MKLQFWTQYLGVGAAVAVLSVACASRMSRALGAERAGGAEHVATAAGAASGAAAGGPAVAGDPVHGQAVYQACAACHTIDENDIGPKHRGVVGRPAGSVEGYGYSAALKQSGLTWDVGTLDRWLTNPSALVPGTKMFFKIDAAQDRADVIAYLQQQK
jgi:cytochrome c